MNFGFAILDFGLRRKYMDKKSIRFPGFRPDNLKSKIQNRKWAGIVALVVTLAMCGAVATAQQPKKVYLIGYQSGADHTFEFTRSEAFRHALRELGYIEGQ